MKVAEEKKEVLNRENWGTWEIFEEGEDKKFRFPSSHSLKNEKETEKGEEHPRRRWTRVPKDQPEKRIIKGIWQQLRRLRSGK